MFTSKNLLGILSIVTTLNTASAQTIVFDGSQLQMSSNLQDTISHTVYVTREVPDTCYQTGVIRYDEKCETQYEQVCHYETRQDCRETTRRECHNETRNECTQITRRECHMENECRDVPDEICRIDAHGNKTCTQISRRECHQENVCRDVPDQICRVTNETVCNDVPDQVCSTREEQVCEQVPHQSCEQVPVYGEVPYACTKTEQVPVGTEVDLNINAHVQINFSEVPQGIQPNEVLELTLSGENLDLSVSQSSGLLKLLIDKKISSSQTGDKQEQLDAVFNVSVIPVQ